MKKLMTIAMIAKMKHHDRENPVVPMIVESGHVTPNRQMPINVNNTETEKKIQYTTVYLKRGDIISMFEYHNSEIEMITQIQREEGHFW